ncbi:hypothetical protein EJB05_15308, partial [Eragrostis curvula]
MRRGGPLPPRPAVLDAFTRSGATSTPSPHATVFGAFPTSFPAHRLHPIPGAPRRQPPPRRSRRSDGDLTRAVPCRPARRGGSLFRAVLGAARRRPHPRRSWRSAVAPSGLLPRPRRLVVSSPAHRVRSEENARVQNWPLAPWVLVLVALVTTHYYYSFAVKNQCMVSLAYEQAKKKRECGMILICMGFFCVQDMVGKQDVLYVI